jgi:hypothetical protein
MTKQELDSLRIFAEIEMANSTHYEGCWEDHGWCALIRLLDYWGADECDHKGLDGSYYGTSTPDNEMDYQYGYCPNCGEKL